MEQLETLKRIFEQGYITAYEYELRKRQIIDQLTNTNLTLPMTNRGMVSPQDKMELVNMLSKLQPRQLEPVFGIIRAKNPERLKFQNDQCSFDVNELDDNTLIEIKQYATELFNRLNSHRPDLEVIDDLCTSPSFILPPNVNTTPEPPPAILASQGIQPRTASEERKKEEPEATGDDSIASFMRLLGPPTPSDSTLNSMEGSEAFSRSVNVEPLGSPLSSFFDELPFSPLEAPVLSPSSILSFDDPSHVQAQVGQAGLSLDDHHHAHCDSSHDHTNSYFDMPLHFAEPLQIMHQEEHGLANDESIHEQIPVDLLNQLLSQEQQPLDSTETAALPNNPENKKIKLKIVIYRVEKGTGPKPWKCDADGCDKGFTDSSNLLKHLRTHTKERPYACSHEGCNKSFAHSSTLKEHLNSHSGQRPFTCQFKGCGKQFAQNSNLRRHVRIHTGDKPYTCKECNKSFTQSTNLKHHVDTVHKGKKAKKDAMEDEEDFQDMDFIKQEPQ